MPATTTKRMTATHLEVGVPSVAGAGDESASTGWAAARHTVSASSCAGHATRTDWWQSAAMTVTQTWDSGTAATEARRALLNAESWVVVDVAVFSAAEALLRAVCVHQRMVWMEAGALPFEGLAFPCGGSAPSRSGDPCRCTHRRRDAGSHFRMAVTAAWGHGTRECAHGTAASTCGL